MISVITEHQAKVLIGTLEGLYSRPEMYIEKRVIPRLFRFFFLGFSPIFLILPGLTAQLFLRLPKNGVGKIPRWK